MKKYIIAAAVVGILIWGLIGLIGSYNTLKTENKRLQTNVEYYSSLGTENIVLQNTVSELKNSKDSLIQKINETQKKLELKPKETKVVTYVETVIHDTIVETIPETFNFSVTVHPNDLTAISVTRQDTTLTVIPTIRNTQTLFIQAEQKYKYKGFFNRLIHFNFSKVTTNRYYIDNTNDLIKVEDTRVIDVKE